MSLFSKPIICLYGLFERIKKSYMEPIAAYSNPNVPFPPALIPSDALEGIGAITRPYAVLVILHLGAWSKIVFAIVQRIVVFMVNHRVTSKHGVGHIYRHGARPILSDALSDSIKTLSIFSPTSNPVIARNSLEIFKIYYRILIARERDKAVRFIEWLSNWMARHPIRAALFSGHRPSTKGFVLLSHSFIFASVCLGLFALLCPIVGQAQGVFIPPKTVFGTVNGVTRPVPAATITVCAANTAGIPCSPALTNTVFKDSGLTVPLSNPFFADSQGNYPQAALAGGVYTITESASGFAGFSYQATVTCSPGGCAVTSLTAQSINNVQTPNSLTVGVDACAKIATSISLLPANGGIVDARGFTGTQACASNPFSGILATGKPGKLILGSTVYTLAVPWIIPQTWTVESPPSASNATTGAVLQASASITFDSTNAVVELGDVAGAQAVKLTGVTINCNNVANSIGAFSDVVNESSALEWVNIFNCAQYGVLIQKDANSGSGPPQNFELHHLNIVMKPAATAGVRIFGNGTALTVRGIDDMTVVNFNLTGTAMTAGLQLDNATGGQYCRMHFENATDGVLLSSVQATSANTFCGISILPVTTVVNSVHISSTASTQATAFIGIQKASTNSIKDDGFAGSGRLAASATGDMGLGWIGNGNPQSVCWADASLNCSLRNIVLLSNLNTNGNSLVDGTRGDLSVAIPAMRITNEVWNGTGPTISTHFNTSGDSIVVNGTASFTVTVGTGAATSTGALTLPTATTAWNCWLTNQTRADLIQQTASSTTSATFTNFGTTFAATNWTNSDVLRGGCMAN